MERQFNAQSRRIRDHLQALANRFRVRWHFRVARGAVTTEIVAASGEVDLVVLGKAGQSLTSLKRVGSTVHAILERDSGLAMVVREKVPLGGPVILVFDGSDSSRRALGIALNIVSVRKVRLHTVVLAENEVLSEEYRREIACAGLARGAAVDFQTLIKPVRFVLIHTLRTLGYGWTVLPCGGVCGRGADLCDLVNELANPIMLVH